MRARRAELGDCGQPDFDASIPGLLISGGRFVPRVHLMPHKFNADRRHKIAKQKFQVTNWATYNESLRQRGDLTVSVSDEALC
jgi:hypothetical protein